ncbi:hypothetical protein [Ktedonobacter racemifer]|uniref:Uncharacterized protein n=1 Tax=Ktedonobacter racemifer DSM 44963 TaxID=485913 RepID=D6TYX4_KTERA|nr:hypothetical protein [Ktedonobacter racemifer]EFH81764.1 hypothetical protein Krac_2511 [Ktedonobacter racemifer DSM 44963]
MVKKGEATHYTAAQTKEKLGITDGQLYNYVNNGTLARVIPPGKKQGVYRREDVDQLARELNAFLLHRKRNTTQFLQVTNEEEMRECMEISQALFSVGRETVKDRMKLLQKNPYTYHMLRDDTQIIGYTATMPLKNGRLEKVLSQTIPVKIGEDDIAEDVDGNTIDLYLHAIGVKPGYSMVEKHSYGARLVSGIIELILDFGKRGITINTIAARSNMPDGIRLMRHAGFTEIEPLTPERRTFVIDVKESGIPFIIQYKEALAKWQEEHK